MNSASTLSPAAAADFVRGRLPTGGLFAGHEWRISPEAFPLEPALARELESLGRVFLQFYRALNLLYRQSVEGRQPAWVSELLDQGKPRELIEWQRHAGFKNEIPRIIRPDLLPGETGLILAELDSVPGGLGLTAWLNQTYSALPGGSPVLGGPRGMFEGFAGIFGRAPQVHVVISQEAATYRPEMEWLAGQIGSDRIKIESGDFAPATEGEAVYRFFELFDVGNVPHAARIFNWGAERKIQVTPPPKPIFEEKIVFALLWNRNLREFWRQNLGDGFLTRLLKMVPYSWAVDPAPLPPHAAIPELNVTDWGQLKTMSQKDRDLILKISGYSEKAWGARGVYLGSDLSQADWSAAVDEATSSFGRSPYVLQRYGKPRLFDSRWFDFASGEVREMKGRVRLCPYYFVVGDGDAARAQLGGVLATICPADKKIIHGMTDAILAPCVVGPENLAKE